MYWGKHVQMFSLMNSKIILNYYSKHLWPLQKYIQSSSHPVLQGQPPEWCGILKMLLFAMKPRVRAAVWPSSLPVLPHIKSPLTSHPKCVPGKMPNHQTEANFDLCCHEDNCLLCPETEEGKIRATSLWRGNSNDHRECANRPQTLSGRGGIWNQG